MTLLSNLEPLSPLPLCFYKIFRFFEVPYGYSRDHRPDLKQFTLSLLTIGEEGIPLYIQVGDGNKLDSQAFPEIIRDFQSQWQENRIPISGPPKWFVILVS